MQPKYITLAKNANNLTGKRFHRLTAIGPVLRDKHKKIHWLFVCDCGQEIVTSGSHVTSGHTKSCGCHKAELIKQLGERKTHGLSKSREMSIWAGMLQRCENPKSKDYPRYGGRGIKVCERWHTFINFYNDMGASPDGTSIERIDNNKGYNPENCRWATVRQQANNVNTNRIFTHNGESRTIAQWAELTGINYYTLYSRLIKRGWEIDRALSTR
jgi:hypothetical protein